MPIDVSFQATAMACIIGPNHSQLVSEVLWGAWLDDALDIIAMTGFTVDHDSFDVIDEPGTRGVQNVVELDAGLAPAVTPSFFGIYDAETGGQRVAYGPVVFPEAPPEGEPLVAGVGAIRLLYIDAGAS